MNLAFFSPSRFARFTRTRLRALTSCSTVALGLRASARVIANGACAVSCFTLAGLAAITCSIGASAVCFYQLKKISVIIEFKIYSEPRKCKNEPSATTRGALSTVKSFIFF